MPAYEYREADGSKTIRVLPVEDRDKFPNRVTVPSSIAFVGTAYDPTITANKIRAGYKAIESKGGFIKTPRRVFEKAWGSHDTKTVMRKGTAVNIV
jgi:hypothetical protein